MKFVLLLSAFALTSAFADYIDCQSETDKTRVRLVTERSWDGDHLQEIRFTKKIEGERWEMVSEKEYRDIYLCEKGDRYNKYPLCVEEFDLSNNFISVTFQDGNHRSHRYRSSNVVFHLTTSDAMGKRGNTFEATLYRSLTRNDNRRTRYASPHRIVKRAITLLCENKG